MDVSQIARRHSQETCCTQQFGDWRDAFPTHGGKRFARPVSVVSLEEFKTLFGLRLREPESIDYHNTTIWPQELKPVGECNLGLAQCLQADFMLPPLVAKQSGLPATFLTST